MCGRFTQHKTPQEVQAFFDLFRVADFPPRYNIAPTQRVLAIRANPQGDRNGDLLSWGLIPPSADTPAIGSKLINCRSESAATKPTFRRAFRERRCLIPATGFYEWQAAGNKETQPWYLTLKSGEPLAFAGLWESWTDPAGNILESCTILTTSANAFMAEVHERMPVILDRTAWPVWLDPEIQEPAAIQELLQPSRSELWQRHPVSRRVNHVKHDVPECITPVKPMNRLFD